MTLTINQYFKNKEAHYNAYWIITAGAGKFVAVYKGETFTPKEFNERFPLHATKIQTALNKTYAADNPDVNKRWMA